MSRYDSLIIGEVARDTNVDYDGTTVKAIGGAVYYSGYAAANIGHKIAVLPKADPEVDLKEAFAKAPNATVYPLVSEKSFVTKNVYHTADRERRTSTVDSVITPYRTDEVWYSYIDGICHVKQRHRNKRGTIKVKNESREDCIYDMLSIMLKARSMNISNMNKGYRYHFQMTDGGKTQDEVLIFRGRSTFQVENSPVKYRCLVFSFIEREDGKNHELLRFYVTDDANHIPVRLDMFLSFGSAKAFLRGYKGVKNPVTSRLN